MGPTAETPYVHQNDYEFEKERTGVHGSLPDSNNSTAYSGNTHGKEQHKFEYLVHGFLSLRSSPRNDCPYFADTRTYTHVRRTGPRRATKAPRQRSRSKMFPRQCAKTAPSFPPRERLQPARQCPCVRSWWGCGCHRQPCALGSCGCDEKDTRQQVDDMFFVSKLRTVSNLCLGTRSCTRTISLQISAPRCPTSEAQS